MPKRGARRTCQAARRTPAELRCQVASGRGQVGSGSGGVRQTGQAGYWSAATLYSTTRPAPIRRAPPRRGHTEGGTRNRAYRSTASDRRPVPVRMTDPTAATTTPNPTHGCRPLHTAALARATQHRRTAVPGPSRRGRERRSADMSPGPAWSTRWTGPGRSRTSGTGGRSLSRSVRDRPGPVRPVLGRVQYGADTDETAEDSSRPSAPDLSAPRPER